MIYTGLIEKMPNESDKKTDIRWVFPFTNYLMIDEEVKESKVNVNNEVSNEDSKNEED